MFGGPIFPYLYSCGLMDCLRSCVKGFLNLLPSVGDDEEGQDAEAAEVCVCPCMHVRMCASVHAYVMCMSLSLPLNSLVYSNIIWISFTCHR